MSTDTIVPGEDVRRLEAWVRQRLRGRVAGLRLRAHDDGLILCGRTTTYYVKQLAQHTLLTATDLRLVANEIEVERDLAWQSAGTSEDSDPEGVSDSHT
jgi:hypothetical protein